MKNLMCLMAARLAEEFLVNLLDGGVSWDFLTGLSLSAS
jgi:hypothetical protein